MDRAAFSYLFIHANSLAELGMDAMLAALDADIGAQGDPYADLSDDEREALALANMGKMDSSGMQDGFAWESSPEHEAEMRSHLAQLEQEAPELAMPAGTEAPDHGVYLERAYAARELVDERITDAMARVDHAALARLLAELPADLPPLTQALNGAQFDQWLACHQAGNEPLNTLVGMLL